MSPGLGWVGAGSGAGQAAWPAPGSGPGGEAADGRRAVPDRCCRGPRCVALHAQALEAGSEIPVASRLAFACFADHFWTNYSRLAGFSKEMFGEPEFSILLNFCISVTAPLQVAKLPAFTQRLLARGRLNTIYSKSMITQIGSDLAFGVSLRVGTGSAGANVPRKSVGSRRWKRLFAVTGAVSAFVACGGSPASSPTGATALSPPAFTIHSSGTIVGDDGATIAGATVTVTPYAAVPAPPPIITVSDASGAYDLFFTGNSTAQITAQRSGYEPLKPSAFVPPGAVTITTNLRLNRLIHLSAGESVRLSVGPGDAMCGVEDIWVCRTVRVTAPRTGTMLLEAMADDANHGPLIEILSPTWPSMAPQYLCCSDRMSIAVTTGDLIVADIMLAWTSPRSAITLRTSMQ
jgi:hypothetical protein